MYVDIRESLMINPSSDMLKKCALQLSIFLARDVGGLFQVLQLSNLLISVWITLFFSFMFRFKLYPNRASEHMRMTSDSSHTDNDYLYVQHMYVREISLLSSKAKHDL